MPRMTLGTNVKQTTDWVPVSRGVYVLSGNGGSWSGATAQLQTKSIDGSTALDVVGATFVADAQYELSFGDDAEARIFISGGPPSGLAFSLARVLP